MMEKKRESLVSENGSPWFFEDPAAAVKWSSKTEHFLYSSNVNEKV